MTPAEAATSRAWLLAAVIATYFAGTVFYVKTLIRERGSEPYYWLSVGFHALATSPSSRSRPP